MKRHFRAYSIRYVHVMWTLFPPSSLFLSLCLYFLCPFSTNLENLKHEVSSGARAVAPLQTQYLISYPWSHPNFNLLISGCATIVLYVNLKNPRDYGCTLVCKQTAVMGCALPVHFLSNYLPLCLESCHSLPEDFTLALDFLAGLCCSFMNVAQTRPSLRCFSTLCLLWSVRRLFS